MSLEWFRRHQKHFLAGLAVFLMVAWGMGGSMSYLAGTRWAGRAFGKRVSMADMETMYARWVASQPGGRYRNAISKAALWQNYILLHEAERLGLDVAETEVELAVKSNPAFMGKNGFSASAYQSFLRRQGISEEAYEKTLKENLLIRKLFSLVTDSVKLSTDEAWRRYAEQNEKIKVKYLAVSADDFTADIQATPEELKAFYEAHKGDFADAAEGKPGYKRAETAQVEYLIARKADLLEPDAVTDDQIKSHYEEHKEQYKIEEKEKPKDDKKKDGESPKPDKAAEEKAPKYRPLGEVKGDIRKKLADEKAQERLAAMMDKIDRKIEKKMEMQFSLASIPEELPEKALGYVKTAFLTRDQVGILPGRLNFDRDISDTDEPIPSAIMDCPEGKFVYQVLSIKPTEVVPFDEVKRQVEIDLKKDKALKKAIEVVEECRLKAKTLEECLALLRAKLGRKPKGLKIAESNFFTRPKTFRFLGPGAHQFDTGIPGDHPKFAEEAFRVSSGKIGLAVEERQDPTCYLMTPVGRQAADKQTFEKEEKQLFLEYTQEKMITAQQAWMADLNKRADLERLLF